MHLRACLEIRRGPGAGSSSPGNGRVRIGFCAIAFLFLLLASPAQAAALEPNPADLPPIQPLESGAALNTFQVKKGFELQLAAAEPLVMDPIALAFDENGRLYVVEMRDYSERRDERLGRIRLLEDTDEDGRFDRSTVFAEHLPWPTAVACYGGGVFVGSTPDILFFKDLDGDGVADVRKLAFTGFGSGVDRINVQQLLNSFSWGLDNRIHGASGGNGGRIVSLFADLENEAVEVRGRDFSFDPRLITMSPETGGGQNGMSFDDWGRKFVCSNSAHLQMLMYEDRYAGQNPRFALPGPLVNIAADGPAAEVFRLSPDEPWRVMRTEWRVSGKVPGLIEGGGRASGYFTAATGITIYRGHAWPEEYHGDAFVADAGSNLIHRKKLHAEGVSLTGRRPGGEESSEFLASRDNWFRPVQMANAPDGTLYIIDMYREIIEHPWSLPEPIKKHLDLNRGNDRGRLYRIVPEGFQQPPLPRLGKASTAELVATLAHPNGWHRDTAARLLCERRDSASRPLLKSLLKSSGKPLGRLHALYVLQNLGELDIPSLHHALRDSHEGVRRHAIRLAEDFPSASLTAEVQAQLAALSQDPDPKVRYQLAFSLGKIEIPGRIQALAKIVRADGQDAWLRAAVFSALDRGAIELFSTLFQTPDFADSPGAGEVLPILIRQIARENEADSINQILALLGRIQNPQTRIPLAAALAQNWPEAQASQPVRKQKALDSLAEALNAATGLIRDPKAPEPVRVECANLLGVLPWERAHPFLLPLLGLDAPPSVQLAAVRNIARYDRLEAGQALIASWKALTPRLRGEAITQLLGKQDRIPLVLESLEAGPLKPADLTSAQIQYLRNHRSGEIRARASTLFGAAAEQAREDIVARLAPALSLKGDIKRGSGIFMERCASCHRHAGEGHAVGPDLASVKSNGKAKLLASFIDPNREVPPQFINYQIETKSGESLQGLIAHENAASITLRRPFGDEVAVPRNEIVSLQSSGQSAMPEGLEAGLTEQAIADLLEFIFSGDLRRP